jgi:hypothetical protein
MNITFLQTSDPFRYLPMLSATAPTVIEYCKRHGYRYESYIGIKRGFHNWQATYNRIYQLQELMERRHSGWAVYLDADAYIVDLDFDLHSYLADKQQFGAILTPSMATDHHWDINAGVVLINLGHPIGRRIVERWRLAFDGLSDQRLLEADQWLEADSDQDFIQIMLRTDPEIAAAVYLQTTDLINSSFATFIRQHLRGYSPDFDSRLAAIVAATGEVMARQPGFVPPLLRATTKDVVDSLYEAILHRSPDEAGGVNAVQFIEHHGFHEGIVTIIRDIFASEEYRARIQA